MPHLLVEVEIRPAVAGDLKLLGGWNQAVDRVVAPALVRQQAGDAVVLLAMIGPFPCGHLLIDFTKKGAQRVGVIWHLGVESRFQGRGVGSAMSSWDMELSASLMPYGPRPTAMELCERRVILAGPCARASVAREDEGRR